MDSLDYYDRQPEFGRNSKPEFVIREENLKLIQTRVMQQMFNDERLRNILSGKEKNVLQRLRERFSKSKKQKRN